MMKKQIYLLLLIFVPFIKTGFAQGETAMVFLRIHPSPDLNAMAGAFTALPTDDAFGFYYNPAQLGHFSKERNLSYHFYDGNVDWLPQFTYSDLTFRSTAVSAGYNFRKINPDFPISIGLGYINTILNLGTNLWTDENGNPIGIFESYEKYRGYAIGIGIDYYVRFNIGYSKKYIESDINISEPVKTSASDFGLQLSAPLVALLWPHKEWNDAFVPFFEFSFGYNLANKGGYVAYIAPSASAPLPRTAKLGYAISFGFHTKNEQYTLRMFKFDWASEARDILVKRNPDGSSGYIDSPGSINLWHNVFLGKGGNGVYIFQGWRFALAETFRYSQGRFWGPGWSTYQKTSGFTIHTRGLLKWLTGLNKNAALTFMAEHFELSYSQTRYTSLEPLNYTQFKGMSLTVFGF